MTTITLTFEQVVATAEQIVSERGNDYRYLVVPGGSCHYSARPDLFTADDPRASSPCIVGEIFTRLGAAEALANSQMSIDAWLTQNDDVVKVDAATHRFLNDVQGAQDNAVCVPYSPHAFNGGATWREAVDYALDMENSR